MAWYPKFYRSGLDPASWPVSRGKHDTDNFLVSAHVWSAADCAPICRVPKEQRTDGVVLANRRGANHYFKFV